MGNQKKNKDSSSEFESEDIYSSPDIINEKISGGTQGMPKKSNLKKKHHQEDSVDDYYDGHSGSQISSSYQQQYQYDGPNGKRGSIGSVQNYMKDEPIDEEEVEETQEQQENDRSANEADAAFENHNSGSRTGQVVDDYLTPEEEFKRQR